MIRAETSQAVPTDFAFSSVPSSFQTKELTVGSRALGEICYSRDTMPDGTVCNPAFLGDLEESSLLMRVYIGNGYGALSTADRFLYEPVTRDFLQELFQKNNVTSVEAHAGLIFATRFFSAAFSPYRVQYFSEVHNPNYPIIAIHAAVERSFTFGGGGSLGVLSESVKEFRMGAKLRILERRFVHGTFSLFQASSEPSESFLPVQTQKAIWLDPSVAWVPETIPWKFKLSATAFNLGKAWPENALYIEKSDLSLGTSIEPPVPLGKIRVGVDWVNLIHASELSQRFRTGASYQLGVLEGMLGYNETAATVGLQFGLQIIQAGIVYEFGQAYETDSPLQNKIATEVAIRL